MNKQCEYCLNFEYDEEYGDSVCVIDIDEDEFYRMQNSRYESCPFFRIDNEYKIVQKQN